MRLLLAIRVALAALGIVFAAAAVSGCDATTGGAQVRSQGSAPFPYNSPY